VLGTEPEVIEEYVKDGKVRIIFWPVLNHGNPSVYSTVSAHCAGQQDPEQFWVMHNTLFENQRELWSATRDYYVGTAVTLGLDQAAFEACYDSPEILAEVMALDSIRRDRGVFGQPTFDANGLIFAGALPFDQFSAALDSVLAEAAP
jgi:protein-disulfide isomerase